MTVTSLLNATIVKTRRGMIIHQQRDECLLIGTGFSVRFRHPRPDGRSRCVKDAESGEFDGDCWCGHHPIRRERPESAGSPVPLLEPAVVRVRLVANEPA
jgi:hypothetical protein